MSEPVVDGSFAGLATDTLDIDDIVLVGPGIVAVKHTSLTPAHRSAFNVFYRNGDLRLEGEPFSKMTAGTINLFDAKGKVVLTHRFTAAADFEMNISGNKLPNGLYFAQASGVRSDGKTVFVRSPIFVAK